MALSSRYNFLLKEKSPQILVQALALVGVTEVAGDGNNKTIVSWAKEVGAKIADVYKADSIPWCGLFMAVVCKRAGVAFPENALWALSWSAFGKPVDTPMLGDVLVFKRKGGGHVGIYVGEDDGAYHVLGGNQSDAVGFTRIAKSRLYCARRTAWKVSQPRNVRRIILTASGVLSQNEA